MRHEGRVGARSRWLLIVIGSALIVVVEIDAVREAADFSSDAIAMIVNYFSEVSLCNRRTRVINWWRSASVGFSDAIVLRFRRRSNVKCSVVNSGSDLSVE